LLWATSFWILVMSVPRVAGLLFNATSVLRFQLAVCVAANAVALLLKYSYAARFGVLGIFLATPISWLFILWPAYIWKIHRWWKGELSPATTNPANSEMAVLL
jgi:hypothetical protein